MHVFQCERRRWRGSVASSDVPVRGPVGTGGLGGPGGVAPACLCTQVRIVVVGLDNSGKTTVLNALKPKKASLETVPTVGFNTEDPREGPREGPWACHWRCLIREEVV